MLPMRWGAPQRLEVMLDMTMHVGLGVSLTSLLGWSGAAQPGGVLNGVGCPCRGLGVVAIHIGLTYIGDSTWCPEGLAEQRWVSLQGAMGWW